MVNKLIRLFGVLSLLWVCADSAAQALEADNGRDLDTGWHFHLGDNPDAKLAAFDDSAWRTFDVPHDWSIEGDYSKANPTGDKCGYLPSGIGWYRHEILMPEAWQGKVVSVEFEGIYMNSEVWLNGERVGGRAYGYMTFSCDLTKFLKPGRNVLAVRVDNSLEPSARWYHGCGIYGHVRLTAKPPVHIPMSGVYVQTPSVTDDSAIVSAAVEVSNASDAAATVQVETEIIAPDGKSVARETAESSVVAGATVTLKQDLKVQQPALWSLESPALYTLKTRVRVGGAVQDDVATKFGIRTLKFDAQSGFFLNGKSVKLKGVCEHQACSPLGAAVPEALLERRLKQLQAMGCNAIRTAHNPQLPAFYDLCDRLGILVMDEVFDGWNQKAEQDYGARFFATDWRGDVTDWVRRDRNHPCVIFWSIGNETGRTDDFKITELIHSLDATRPTTGGAVLNGVDVAGFNGIVMKKLSDYHQKNPQTPIVKTEEPHTFQTRGFYQTMNAVHNATRDLPNYAEPEVFPGGPEAYRSSYDNCGRRAVIRDDWQQTLSQPWMMGGFRWTGFDYMGESTWSGKKTMAREFNFGVIDLAGFPKDDYYLYQSLWTAAPMVHLLPHWTHPGLVGKTIPVVAYANADEVELFQDGKSLGRQKRPELFDWVWQVPYAPGELKAVAYRGGAAVAETIQRTAGEPAMLKIETDNADLKPDRKDMSLVSLSVCDAKGTLVPDADHCVQLAYSGPVRWLGGENGDPIDLTPQRETGRKVFAGLSRGFFAGIDGQSGPIEVSALAILGPKYFDKTAAITIAYEHCILRGASSGKAVDIRYTLDGTAPSATSARYAGPFAISGTATVRAAVFRDGHAVVSCREQFSKGPRPVISPAKGAGDDMGKAEDPTQEKKSKRKKR